MVATVTVSSGQTLSGGTVGAVFLVVQSGGRIVDETITNNGSVFVESGGSATGTTVSGRLTISAGGVAAGTTVASGGQEEVAGLDSGGTITGGNVIVSSGGTAVAPVIESAAGAVAAPGGRFVNPVVSSGGTLFATPPQVTGVTLAVGASLYTDFAGVARVSASLDSATDVLSLTEGSVTTTIQLAGSYTGDNFQLASLSGTEIIITVANGNVVIPTGSGTLAVSTSAPFQTAFAVAISMQAASAQILSGTGGAPRSVSVASAVVIDLPNGIDTITETAAVPQVQVLLANAGATYTTGATAVSTVVAADATPVTIVNNNPSGALLALTGIATAGNVGDTLEGWRVPTSSSRARVVAMPSCWTALRTA